MRIGRRTSNDSSETRSAERHKTSGEWSPFKTIDGYGTDDGSEILHTNKYRTYVYIYQYIIIYTCHIKIYMKHLKKNSIKQKPRVPQLSSVNYSYCRISQKKHTSSTCRYRGHLKAFSHWTSLRTWPCRPKN